MNSVVGDLAGNRDRILENLGRARSAGADVVVFPELVITGYPPEDLLLRPGFIRAAERTLAEVARSARGIVALVGAPYFERDLYNACAVCSGGVHGASSGKVSWVMSVFTRPGLIVKTGIPCGSSCLASTSPKR